MRIVYILGTDGSGKTTIATRLAEEIGGPKWQYQYCQVRPILIWPLRRLARLLFLQKVDEFRDYSEYRKKKQQVCNRRKGIRRIYTLIWYLDFVIQAWPKINWARIRGRNLIVDRYYLDIVVNEGVLQNNSLGGMLRDARLLEWILPKADLHIFLNVDEETAYRRKDDIQSELYLRERKTRYMQLARIYDFKLVDANVSIEKVMEGVKTTITQNVELEHEYSPIKANGTSF